MELRIDFETLLAHDHWANGQALDSLEAMKDPPAKGVGLVGHVIGAEACWIQRMCQEGGSGESEAAWLERMGKQGAFDWPEGAVDLAVVRRTWKEDAPALWSEFLADKRRADPNRTFSYVNFLSQSYSAKVQDALIQLMLHGAYHRGQVGAAVRAAGGEPAVVDYMRAVRSGVIA